VIFGFLIVSKQAKKICVRVAKSEIESFRRETYQSQATPFEKVMCILLI
jgi:hypothetical protein